MEHEARVGSELGGHTISKHVGKSKEYLLDRLKNDPRIKSHVSTFYNLNIAERAITDAMKKINC
ncbi:hypothetical protein KPZ19_00970 [Taylorella equigenitalis]|nr:hypothetical protein KPZ19_00970 [Taylorella equigenitalis]